MATSPYFGPELFDFFRDLVENNDREWFKSNKSRFEDSVREPMQAFIADFAGPLAKISKHMRADPRPVGGSLFRIYRDVRFSKDKSPYKTHGAAHFRHKKAKDVHAPGFYLHLEPGRVMAGAGIWRPGSKSVAKIRATIAEDPKAWTKLTGAKAFREACAMEGESLKRPPRGFARDHPLIEDLKRKDFIAMRHFDEADATGPGFFDDFVAFCRTTSPFQRFLCEALELEY